MVFKKGDCVIRTVYCGKARRIPATNSRRGTSYECLRKGFGAGKWETLKESLPQTSLQRIPYIGKVYEANLKKAGVGTTGTLVKKVRGMSAEEKRKFIKKIVTRKSGSVDQKAFNSVVLFLWEKGVDKLPGCKIVRD